MKIKQFLICSILGVSIAKKDKKDWKSLYPRGKSAVEDLDPDEFNNILAMSETTSTLVEFYAPWCPHCQHFSSIYEKVGEHYTGNVGVRITSVDCVHYRDTCSDHGIHSYPTILVFGVPSESSSYDKDGYKLKFTGKETPQTLIDWIDSNTKVKSQDTVSNIRNEDAAMSLHEPLQPSKLYHSGQRWSSTYTGANQMPARLRLGDVASSLMFALRYGVFVDGDSLKPDQRTALGTVLSVLTKAFPGPSSDRRAIQELSTLVDSGELRNDKEWEDFLSQWRLQGRLATSDMRWSPLCDPSRRKKENSKANGRHISGGYTCGLWTMFHMLTMTAPHAGLTADEVTGAIRTFVDHFFGCENCRNHFLQMFDACEHGRCDSTFIENAQLWLWKTHNAVNVRVAFEALKDEAAKSQPDNGGVVDLDPSWALWPTDTDCPQCRRITTDSHSNLVEWDETEVKKYLKRAYDIGLWEDSKLSEMVQDAEGSKQSFSRTISSLLQRKYIVGLTMFMTMYVCYRQRRKHQKGAHAE